MSTYKLNDKVRIVSEKEQQKGVMSDLIVKLALGATLPQKHISSRPGLPKKRYSSFEVRQLVLFGAAAWGCGIDALHSRVNDKSASACAFDLRTLNGDDLRRRPYVERKAALRKLLRHGRGIQYVEHAEGHGDRLFAAACKLGLEGIVSKKFDAPYRSGSSKTWIKVKNPNAPAASRARDGTF